MTLIIFIFGLCIGSFLNVCVYRLPASRSIIRPRSACPRCGIPIAARDNIPLISYAWLRGKCRHCGIPIPLRYPAVELITGLFAVAAFYRFGPTPAFLVYFAFIACLIVITFIDLDHGIIPDAISLPGIPIFFIGARLVPNVSLTDSLLGLALGFGSLYAVAWIYEKLTGKQGMGGGDVKLLAMMGVLLGPAGVIFTIFVSSAVGAVIGLVVMLATRGTMKMKIPYGPFLALGGALHVLYGPELINLYLGLYPSPLLGLGTGALFPIL